MECSKEWNMFRLKKSRLSIKYTTTWELVNHTFSLFLYCLSSTCFSSVQNMVTQAEPPKTTFSTHLSEFLYCHTQLSLLCAYALLLLTSFHPFAITQTNLISLYKNSDLLYIILLFTVLGPRQSFCSLFTFIWHYQNWHLYLSLRNLSNRIISLD